MPAVTLVEKQQADAGLRDVLDAAEKHFGHLPNLVKALASNPAWPAPLTPSRIEVESVD